MDLFGWTMNKYPGLTVYYLVGTVTVDEKTMMPIRPDSMADYTKRKMLQCPRWLSLNYISVESVEEYSKKVEALGRQNRPTKDADSWYRLAGTGT
jgi:hypothetical protein